MCATNDETTAPGARRKRLFFAAMLVLVYGVSELLSLGVYRFVAADSFSFSALQARRAGVVRDPGLPPADGPEGLGLHERLTVHPYTGFTLNALSPEVNEFGFIGPSPPLGASAPDSVVVAVMGGSVAMQLVMHAGDVLRQALRVSPALADKDIILVNLALPGLKQPQQLMTLNYFLALGAHFDIVINLDGFNDLVLSDVENLGQQVFPMYPRRWRSLVSGLSTPEQLRAAGRVALLEERRQRWARRASVAGLRHSVTINMAWFLADRGLADRIARRRMNLTRRMLEGPMEDLPPRLQVLLGPQRVYAGEEEKYTTLAAFWARSSQVMHDLGRGRGFRYFHFLQPNQYAEGSKIFTQAERTVALRPKSPYAPSVRAGYPYMVEAGMTLQEAGVAFTDLTMIFSDIEEPLYTDGCCHVNERGSQLIALVIAQAIRVHLKAPESP